ncbi:PepSY domain-containing protein [uncultured Brevibacterium sp.]|uniref:PepSY domain-containing protein n=1 Tax=uncultured Brevibacterium sp. TaxID=189678 RepID=UPI0025ED1C41|nr:PepSY domain-containing protein [uncultured Brevibacterium sp.]
MKKLNVRTAFLAVPVAAALALAGCGGGDDQGAKQTTGDEQAPADQATEESNESVDDNGVTSLGDDDDENGENEKGGSVDAANAAIDTAEGEVKDSKAIGIEFEDDGAWKVDVLAGSKKTEVKVSADGSSVEGKDDEEKADSKDKNAASVVRQTLKEAIASATRHTPGTVDEAELSSDGNVHWEVKVYPKGKSESVKFKIHHRSGDIIKK